MKFKFRSYYLNTCSVIIALAGIANLFGCKKQDEWLNVKNNKHIVTPQTIADFQAVLDNAAVLNSYGSITGLVGTDNFTLTDANLNSSDAITQNVYLWKPDLFQGARSFDWTYEYQQIEIANIVLDGLKSVSDQTNQDYKNVRGSALFFRAKMFYGLSQLFCKPFNSKTAGTDAGIPLKLTSDVKENLTRGTVLQTYNQIISDLKEASQLLPDNPLYRTRPSAIAANALLAKVCLAMSDYKNSFTYVDLALKKYGTLLDYNTLTVSATNPFPTFGKGHPEIIFYSMTFGSQAVWASSSVKGRVDPQLYSSYENPDLRKGLFYTADGVTGTYKFKGSYSVQSYNFDGIATDELYLIRAECFARAGDIPSSLADLNLLLKNRYLKSAFVPYSTTDFKTLIQRIILERRKELPFTGNLRWEDLRRYNQETDFAITLSRTAAGKTYQLLPNDNRYTFPIPDEEVQLNNFQQNLR